MGQAQTSDALTVLVVTRDEMMHGGWHRQKSIPLNARIMIFHLDAVAEVEKSKTKHRREWARKTTMSFMYDVGRYLVPSANELV